MPVSYGIIVDNSGTVRPYMGTLILTTKAIVRHNKTQDRTFLDRFVGRDKIERLQDLTEDTEKISNAADDFYSEGGQTALIDALYQSADYLANSTKDDVPNRRLSLIVVSDGDERASKHKYDELIKLSADNKIAIYSIGFSKFG